LFKKKQARLGNNKAYVNTKLANIQIKSEHCIGLLARLQAVNKIHDLIKNGTVLPHAKRLIVAAAVLHNFMLLYDVSARAKIQLHRLLLHNQLAYSTT